MSRKAFSLRTIRKLVVNNPGITIDELLEAAAAAGETYSRNSVQSARREALDMIDVMKESGHWQD